jgi:hypothetical protein
MASVRKDRRQADRGKGREGPFKRQAGLFDRILASASLLASAAGFLNYTKWWGHSEVARWFDGLFNHIWLQYGFGIVGLILAGLSGFYAAKVKK